MTPAWTSPKKSVRLLIAGLLYVLIAGTGQATDLTDPYQILLLHYEAAGGLERLKKSSSSYSEGRVRYDDLQGTFKHWDKRPLQFRSEEDYSIISQIAGDSGKFAWFFDTNGQLLIIRDEDTLKRRRISELLDRYEHLDRQSPYFSLSFAGLTSHNDLPCYEVVLNNTINDDKSHFFFDAQTFRMVRSLNRQPDMEIESVYGDYQFIDGILVAFYQLNIFHPWKKEEETWITKYINEPTVDEKLFTPPEKNKGYTLKNGGGSASIPFQFLENLIYLPVTIGGDTQYWILDSGASMSVIDKDYAVQHGLDVQGSIKGYGFGELFTLGFVNVPDYQVGPILFDSQKFYVSEGLTEKSFEPVISGILGYDFLSRFVVEIDYDLQQATFHNPETFVYHGDGVIIDAPFKYRTFTLPVTLNGVFTSLWSVDLGSYHTSIHYPFAEKHGLLERPGMEIISQGMSTISQEKNVMFGCLQIDRLQLDTPVISIPLEKGVGATALGEVGGNLGNSTLRHFRLFLHYPEQKLILEKGASYSKVFPHDRSGLILGRSAENQPMVSFIANNSPATKAGLIAGDLVLAMAGQELIPNGPMVPLRETLRGPVGTEITLKLKREDEEITTTLVLEELHPEDQARCKPPTE